MEISQQKRGPIHQGGTGNAAMGIQENVAREAEQERSGGGIDGKQGKYWRET